MAWNSRRGASKAGRRPFLVHTHRSTLKNSGRRIGRKLTVFCLKTSRQLSTKSVNFFEQHVFLVRGLAENGQFFARKPPSAYRSNL